jgi:uncharacterized protein HemX
MTSILESLGLVAIGAIVGGGLVYLFKQSEVERERQQKQYNEQRLYWCGLRVVAQSKSLIEEKSINASLHKQLSHLHTMMQQGKQKAKDTNRNEIQILQPPKIPKLPYT